MFGINLTKPVGPDEKKQENIHNLIAYQHSLDARWSPRNYAAMAREGFMQNPVVYRCIRMIAEAAASIPLFCEQAEVQSLLVEPNMDQSGQDMFETLYTHLLLSGSAYVQMVVAGENIRELHLLRPDRVQVLADKKGRQAGWEYTIGQDKTRLLKDEQRGRNPVFHLKLFHPASDHYGLSPIEAAARAIDIHNAGASWNKAMLDNAARPSGALVFRSETGERLNEEQFERLKTELANSHQGHANSGRPLLLEGGLEWKPMSLTPTDMDFHDGRHAAAREIALAFGVPPMLLGIPGDNTYANYREANRAFWRQTILPLTKKTKEGLQNWLQSWEAQKVCLRLDTENVPALQEDQDSLWKRITQADFLSAEEKKQLVGLKGRQA